MARRNDVVEESPVADVTEETVVEETPAPAVVAFELGETELGTIARKGGREAAPAKYLEEVRAAIGKDKAFGIAVEDGVKGTKVTSELRKAAKQLGVHIRLWDRTDAGKRPEGTGPFVGFKVIDKPANPGVEDHTKEDHVDAA